MKALQYVTIGSRPELREIETPSPGPGQVLLKISAAGACHSDEFIMSLPEEQFGYPLPQTLGHEGAGVIAELGEGVKGLEIGAPMVVYGPRGCGHCAACLAGKENYCRYAAERGITPPGLGSPGCMAEYLLIDNPRHLVPLGDLDPVATVALTDAGLTPYHAIKPSLAKLVPGTVAVVIGAGGLGHIGIQILRALSSATVVALDIAEDKRQLAVEVGAHYALPSDDSAVEEIKKISGGWGATAIFDFVGNAATAALATKLPHFESDIVMIGVGDGAIPVGIFTTPWGASARATYWGSIPELHEVLELARVGAIHVETEVFSLDNGTEAYQRLHDGTLRGRAVVVP